MKTCVKIDAYSVAELARERLWRIERKRVSDCEKFITELVTKTNNSFWRRLFKKKPMSREEIVQRYEWRYSQELWLNEMWNIDWYAASDRKFPQALLEASELAIKSSTYVCLSIDDFITLKS